MNHIKLLLLTASFIVPPLLALSILLQKGINRPKKVMVGVLLNATLIFAFNYLYFEQLYLAYSFILSLHITTMLWLFPLFYLFLKATIGDQTSLRTEWWHLLPGAILGIVSATVCYGILDQTGRVTYLIHAWDNAFFTERAMKVMYGIRVASIYLIAGQVITYSIVIRRLTRCYTHRLLEEFSNIERFSLNWLHTFNVSFVTALVICLLLYAFRPFAAFNDLFFAGALCLFSAFTWVIGTLVLRQQKPIILYMPAGSETSANAPSTPEKDELLARKLLDYMENQQAFLRSDVDLTFISKELGTNRTYLSTLINQKFGINFNTFINRYRAEYAANHLKLYPQITKEELAVASGFGSTLSMRRAMKRGKGEEKNYISKD